MLEIYLFIGFGIASYNLAKPAWRLSKDEERFIGKVVTFVFAIGLWPLIVIEWIDKRKR